MDDKDFKSLPTREGGAQGAATERRLLEKVGGSAGSRTVIRENNDGSVTTLRTRDGSPEFVTVAPPPKRGELVERDYALRKFFPTVENDILSDTPAPLCVAYIKTVELVSGDKLNFKKPPADGLANDDYYASEVLYSADGICSFRMYYPKRGKLTKSNVTSDSSNKGVTVRFNKPVELVPAVHGGNDEVDDLGTGFGSSGKAAIRYRCSCAYNGQTYTYIIFKKPDLNDDKTPYPFPVGAPTRAGYQTAAIQTLPFDKQMIFGQPHSGLWKAGTLTFDTGSMPYPKTGQSIPDSTGKPLSGGVVVLAGAKALPTIPRTLEQVTADATRGIKWRNYGLLSGGVYGASENILRPEVATFILNDEAFKSWILRIYPVPGATHVEVTVTRFSFVDINREVFAESARAQVPIPTGLADAIADTPFARSFVAVAQNLNGTDFVIGVTTGRDHENGFCCAMARGYVSGAVNTVAADLGLTINLNTLVEHLGRQNVTLANTANPPPVEYQTRTSSVMLRWGVFNKITHTTDEFFDAPLTSTTVYGLGPTGYWEQLSSGPITGHPAETETFIYSIYGWVETPGWETMIEVQYGPLVTNHVWADYAGNAFSPVTVEVEYGTHTKVVRTILPSEPNIGGGATGTQNYAIEDTYASVYCKVSTTVHGAKIHQWSDSSAMQLTSGGNQIHLHWDADLVDDLVARAINWANLQPPYINYTDHMGVYTALHNVHANLKTISPEVTFDPEYLIPNFENPTRYPNSCMAKMKMSGGQLYAATLTPLSVVAPSGTEAALVAPELPHIHASWNPATDQLAVDSETICWF